MAEDDIYGNRVRYERFKENIKVLLVPPAQRRCARGSGGKYQCRNPSNLRYFEQLFAYFEAKDISYIRRIRTVQTMKTICHFSTKKLAHLTRDDINEIVATMHGIYRTPTSKETFIKELKYIFRVLFPEKDAQGRPDETLVPYVVRHLSGRIDRSREKLRQDRLTLDEFERVVNYFGNDARIQAYLTLSLESLSRPQELLYVRLRDVELFDNYAKIYISEHGKEGVGLLQCIDSYPYLLKWVNVHPFKKDKGSFLFVNIGDTNRCQQLKPKNINKFIRKACKDLGIDKPITCYSLKRNGVTIRRLRGETDMEIQHAARWTSTKQLKTYDLSNQEDAFRRELEKRGLIPSTNGETATVRRCAFCDKMAGFGELLCQQCKRPLDREVIRKEQVNQNNEIKDLRQELSVLKEQILTLRHEVMPELMLEVLTELKKRRTSTGNSNGKQQRPPTEASQQPAVVIV